MGLPLVADRAVLVPTAPPNEVEISMTHFVRLLNLPRLMIYCTPEERDWVQKVSATRADHAITAAPMKSIERSTAHTLRTKHRLQQPNLLFMGRVGVHKGCDVLLAHYQHYVETTTNLGALILAGALEMSLPHIPGLFRF